MSLSVLLWVKSLHILAVIAWMAALLYLPRLMVYHADSPVGSPQSDTFKVMERRLLRGIALPSMIAVWITGPILASGAGLWTAPWLHAKLVGVLALSGIHGYLTRQVRAFASDSNRRSARFYRILNEVPAVILVAIVLLVTLNTPF